MKFVGNRINNIRLRDLLPQISNELEVEVVGWARPEVAPPRNGRTSKALYALGFNVKIY